MRVQIIIFFILAIVLITSCQTEETIKIGYIGPMTGDAASIGAPGVAAAELAVKEINNAGGLLGKKLELIVEDDACSAQSVQAMNKLININNVVAISGPDCGSAAGPALPMAQEAGVPVVIRWASAPDFSKVGDYIFRVYPSDAFQGEYAADYIFNTLRVKKVAVMWVNNDYGKGLRDVFVEEFANLGGEILFDQPHESDSTDLKTELIKVKELEPELIYAPTYRGVGRVLLKQIKELDVNLPVIAGDALDTDEIILAPEAVGVIYSVSTTNNPKGFKQRVFEATGVKADKITAPLAYDSVIVIADAIKRAGTLNQADIREALEQTSIQGIGSYIEFDENGDLKQAEYEMRIVRDGESVPYVSVILI